MSCRFSHEAIGQTKCGRLFHKKTLKSNLFKITIKQQQICTYSKLFFLVVVLYV